jgi:hypothetical protein
MAKKKDNKFGNASLYLAIAAAFTCLLSITGSMIAMISMIFSVASFTLGIMQIRQKNTKSAFAGIIISILCFVPALLWFLFWQAMSSFGHSWG